MDLIRAAEKMRSQKTVSLNIDARRAVRKDDLDRRLTRENERRTALGLEPIESLDEIEDDDLPDVLLDQAAGIVTDLATMRQIGTKPAQTAQIQP